ncbi:MAG TPA: hypothetical protein VF985_10395 [Mariniflexile sp.]
MKKLIIILVVLTIVVPTLVAAYGGAVGGGAPTYIPVNADGSANWAINNQDIKYRYYVACQKIVKAVSHFTRVINTLTGVTFIVEPGTFLGCQYKEVETLEPDQPQDLTSQLPDNQNKQCLKNNPLATLINNKNKKVVVPVCSQAAQWYFSQGYELCREKCKIQ